MQETYNYATYYVIHSLDPLPCTHTHTHPHPTHATTHTGEADPVVPFEMGRLSAEFAKTFNKTSYEFKSYPGLAHSSCPEVHSDCRYNLIQQY